MLDKKTIDEILKIQGEVRGVVFQTDGKYVLSREGEQGLEKLEREMEKIGQSIKYGSKVNATSWYPLSWRVLSLAVIKDLFNWTDEDVFNMGFSAPKYSFIVKTLLRYFVSIKKTFTESAKYWQEHYSVGQLESPEIDEEQKRLVLHLKNFNVYPILCNYFKGYFKALTQLVVRSERIDIEETKCVSKGDDYHEFVITWK